MSLVDFALRLSTVEALRGKTLAGEQIFDEPVDPLTDALSNKTFPLIAVFTHQATATIRGNDLLCPEKRSLDLLLQIYLPDEVVIADDAGLKINARGAGAKLVMDIISRQIDFVFLSDNSPWAVMRRALTFAIHEVQEQSFIVQNNHKQQLLAAEIKYRLEPLAEPGFGPNQSEIWQDFTGLMQAEARLSPLVSFFTKAIAGGTDLSVRQQQQAILGVQDKLPKALGLDELGPPLNQATITGKSFEWLISGESQ